MPLSVQGKHALITGGASGINLAAATLLLKNGCSVIIADLHLTPELQTLLTDNPHPNPSNKDLPSATFHKTDVASWPQLTSLWTKALETFSTIEIVIPGAGVYEPSWSAFWNAPRTETNPDSPSRDAADADPGRYALLDINVVAPIRLSQLAIGYWTQNRISGNLLHVGSVGGYTASITSPLYIASKHALHGFVQSLGNLRDELGIRVSAVAPGAVKTPLWVNPEKGHMVTDEPVWMSPGEVAQRMLELLTEDGYGDGTILEVTPGAVRVIPLFGALPPDPSALAIRGIGIKQHEILSDLKSQKFLV